MSKIRNLDKSQIEKQLFSQNPCGNSRFQYRKDQTYLFVQMVSSIPNFRYPIFRFRLGISEIEKISELNSIHFFLEIIIINATKIQPYGNA